MTSIRISNPMAIAGIIFSSLNQSVRPYFSKVCRLWVRLVKLPLEIPAWCRTPWWWICADCSSLSEFSANVSFTGMSGAPGDQRLTFWLLLLPLAPSRCLADLLRPLFPCFSSSLASISCKMAQNCLYKSQSCSEKIFRPAMFQPWGWDVPDQVPFLGWSALKSFIQNVFLRKLGIQSPLLFYVFLKSSGFEKLQCPRV